MRSQRPRSEAEGCLDLGKRHEVLDVGVSTEDDAGRNTDLSGAQDYQEIWRVEVKPRWRSGVIQIAGNIADDPAGVGVTYQYAAIEFRVIGYVGPAQRILRRGVLGGVAGNATHLVQEADRYTWLSVEARKVMDGAIGSSVAPSLIAASVLSRWCKA